MQTRHNITQRNRLLVSFLQFSSHLQLRTLHISLETKLYVV